MSGQRILALSGAAVSILGFRILFTGLAASLFSAVLKAARKKLLPVLRSWLWGAAFLLLFLPFERSITLIMIALPLMSLKFSFFLISAFKGSK